MFFSNKQFDFIEKEIMSIYDQIETSKEFYKNSLSSSANHLVLLGKITACKDAMDLIEELPKKIKTKKVLEIENILIGKHLDLISNLKLINQKLNNSELELVLKNAIDGLEKVREEALTSGLSLPTDSQ